MRKLVGEMDYSDRPYYVYPGCTVSVCWREGYKEVALVTHEITTAQIINYAAIYEIQDEFGVSSGYIGVVGEKRRDELL